MNVGTDYTDYTDFYEGLLSPLAAPPDLNSSATDGGLEGRLEAVSAREELPKRPERAEFPSPGQSSWVR